MSDQQGTAGRLAGTTAEAVVWAGACVAAQLLVAGLILGARNGGALGRARHRYEQWRTERARYEAGFMAQGWREISQLEHSQPARPEILEREAGR